MKPHPFISATLTGLLLLTLLCVGCNEKPRVPERVVYDARGLLQGKKKDLKKAKEILLDVANNHADRLFPDDLCYVYVYLGYIADLSNDREEAIEWFKKAAALEGPQLEFIREVAESGITEPITWLRHLDGKSARPPKREKKIKIIERIGDGYLTWDSPSDSSPTARKFTQRERLKNFIILWEAIDRYYSFFEPKQIDWKRIRERYRPQVIATEDTHEFYLLLIRFVRELKDGHSWVENYTSDNRLGYFRPYLSLQKIENKAVVVDVGKDSDAYAQGIRRGSILLEVEAEPISRHIEKMRPQMRIFSSERTFQDTAYRKLLNGSADKVTGTFVLPGETEPVALELKRETSDSEEMPDPDFAVKKGDFMWYGLHPSGIGYIRILSFHGRMKQAAEFDDALEALKNSPGLILDIRENHGGFGTGQHEMIGRLLTKAVPARISFRKSGPGHNDFENRVATIKPSGSWQYTKPVAVLTNHQTGSAADLFATNIFSTKRAITIGTQTHGNLSGSCVFVVLPCGISVRISSSYIADPSGKIIEGNGNTPDIIADQTYEDLLKGRDTVLDRAVRELQKAATSH